MTSPARSSGPAAGPSLAHRPVDLVCVGTALVDHLAFAEDRLLAQLGLARGAMQLVDAETSARLRRAVGEGRQVSGGTVANTAVGVASLGGRAVFVGAVADDPEGDRYAADLEAAGVEAVLARLPAAAGQGTGRCVVVVSPDAERTMATTLGVGPQLDASAIDAALLARARLAYFDGYVLDFPSGPAIVDSIVASCRAAGTLLAFSPADAHLVERHRAAVTALVSGPVGLLIANEPEALALTGATDAAAALEAIARPGLVVVVTRGADGVLLAAGSERAEVPAESLGAVVDATGAGDLFTAGLCFGIGRGLPLTVAARLGTLAAAEVICHLGARPERSLSELADARLGIALAP